MINGTCLNLFLFRPRGKRIKSIMIQIFFLNARSLVLNLSTLRDWKDMAGQNLGYGKVPLGPYMYFVYTSEWCKEWC